jgi:CDGSH-type Zn-finger protein
MNDTPASAPRIRVTPGGPYLVTGSVPLTRRRIVLSEHEESLAWETTGALESAETVALCRCGHSANKPFCDGSHARVGFDGAESAPTSTYDERATVYAGERSVVRDDRGLCEHAGFCGNRLTNVWRMAGEPSDADSVLRAQMIRMIEHCPSGALSYRLSQDGPDLEPGLGVGIAVSDDGPYLVTGAIPLERADGAPFEARNRMTLCRCGASSTKPLCDGSHKSAGFRDA